MTQIIMGFTARDYMNLYRNLPVPVTDAAANLIQWKTVDVHKYLLALRDNAQGAAEHYNINNATNALGTLESKVSDHFSKGNTTLKVTVGLAERSEREFRSARETMYYAGKAFWGKGCPEEVQITLQLAIRFGMTDAAGVQAYCDQATDHLAQGRIGLDCNGFVGNYLQHGFNWAAWDDNKPGNTEYPANNTVGSIMQRLGPEVQTAANINMLKTYVLGMVNPATGRVIDRYDGPNLFAHIMITTPWPHPKFTAANKIAWVFGVVESTDGGLIESEYNLTERDSYIFNAERTARPMGELGRNILVRMQPID